MLDKLNFYIDGKWVAPAAPKTLDVINPANEEAYARISLGSKADVDKAVAAARKAFETYSRTTREERLALLQKIVEVYQKHYAEMVETISREMGAPLGLSKAAQAASGLGHIAEAIRILRDFQFERVQGSTAIVYEAAGVCGLITPWNWPVNQIACKVAPALAAGCTMVLKPSEIAPMSALLFAEILDEAGVPPGVFNLVNGDGPTVGEAMSAHPGIDMMSFTGSTRAGIAVAKAAADTVKRVTQELGGKSANIILDDADLKKAVVQGVQNCFSNSGQSCNAPTRMFVPAAKQNDAMQFAKGAAESAKVGDPFADGTTMGPVVSEVQFDKIQKLIQKGIEEGATLVTGGLGRPEGVNRGYYVRPTVFANVRNDMTIAREEIFGPVLATLSFRDLDEALRIANDVSYGLAAAIWTRDLNSAHRAARALRAGVVYVNCYDADDITVPFGGYKQSGFGRDKSLHAFDKYTELKTTWIDLS